MRRSGSLVVLLLVFVSLIGTPGRASTRSVRSAPYDFGCLDEPPCVVQWGPARDGEITGVRTVTACVLYGPPFVLPCFRDDSTSTGVDVE
ncbi:MAG: hypothetical protein WD826_07250, partial [Actinomycetota bacterium]